MSRCTRFCRGQLRLAVVLAVVLWNTIPACPEDLWKDRPVGLRVVAADRETDAILDRVDHVIAAANAEDLDDFIRGFAPSCRPAVRREAGLFFVQHDLAVELTDRQLLAQSEQAAEVAVNYLASLDSGDVRVISILALTRLDDTWYIASERVIRRTSEKSGCATGTCGEAVPVAGGFCIGGRCQVR